MQATIYITANAMATVTALDGLDEGARDLLAWRPETDIRGHEGYYLNAESMRLAVLHEGADVALVLSLSLSPADAAKYDRHVSFPPELRGVVFSGAAGLPKDYERTLAQWSPFGMSLADQTGAQHVQSRYFEYPVPEIDGRPQDALLSNGVIICLKDLPIDGLDPASFIEIQVPILADFLGMDRWLFDSNLPYAATPEHPSATASASASATAIAVERIYLRVGDIRESLHPDAIFIAVLKTENFDSNFFV